MKEEAYLSEKKRCHMFFFSRASLSTMLHGLTLITLSWLSFFLSFSFSIFLSIFGYVSLFQHVVLESSSSSMEEEDSRTSPF